jgi:elongation factor Ts
LILQAKGGEDVNITAIMVKELREITGAGMMDCKKALGESNGDIEAAKELLRKKGQAIANKKSSRETKEGAISIRVKENRAVLLKIACETDFVAINDKFKEFISKMAEQALETGTEGFLEKRSSEGVIKDQFVEAISKLGENIVFLGGEFWEAAENSVIGSYTHTNSKIGVMVELQADKMVNIDRVNQVAKDIAMHIAASNVAAIAEDDLDPEVIEKERLFLIDQAKDSGKPTAIIEKMVAGRLVKYKREVCLLYQPYVKDPERTIEQYLADSGKELGLRLLVKRFYKESF